MWALIKFLKTSVQDYVEVSADNPLPVTSSGVQTVQAAPRVLANSSTTPLGAGATYTSPSIDISAKNEIRGKVYSDQSGTLNIQQSDDGTTWDTVTAVAVSGGIASKVSDVCFCRYLRAVYINGATPQTTFRLSLYTDTFGGG